MTENNLPHLPASVISRRLLLQRTALIGSAAFLGGPLLAACTSADTPAGVATEGVGGAVSDEEIDSLGWGVATSLDSLDIARSFSVTTGVVAFLAYDTLVTYDQNLKVIPWLAEPSQPDAETVVFDLKPDISFSDGTPLTPEDVAWSYMRHLEQGFASQMGYLLATLQEAKVTGPNQVTLSLSGPDPTILVAATLFCILNKEQGIAAGNDFGSPKAIPIGTGMYTLSEYTPAGGVTASRRDDYWGDKPKVATIDIKPIPNSDTLRLAAQEGDIGGSFEISPDQLRQWNPKAGLRSSPAAGLNIFYLSFPMDQAPFNDVHVRRAIALCMDREGYVKSLFYGAGEAATSITTRGHWQGIMTPEETEEYLQSLPSYAFDVEAAKAELALSNSPSGFTAELIFDREDKIGEKIVTSLASQAEVAGMTITPTPKSSNEIRNEYVYGDNSAFFQYGFYASYADPIDYMQQMLPTDLVASGNSAHYSNPEIDKLVKAQAAAMGEDRAEMLRRMGTIAQDDLPYAPIVWNASTIGISDTIRFADFDAFDSLRPNWAAAIGRPA